MPQKYIQEHKPRPDAPGFWYDRYLTNYGCQVVRGFDGKLYALGWGPGPVLVDTLRAIPNQWNAEFHVVIKEAGWHGPFPVPSYRRYEIRKLRADFVGDQLALAS